MSDLSALSTATRETLAGQLRQLAERPQVGGIIAGINGRIALWQKIAIDDILLLAK
jgi:hypothetical protein